MIRKNTRGMFIFCCLATATICKADESEINIFDDPTLERKIASAPSSATPSECLNFLYELHINRILACNAYNYTYPLPQRQIFTYPALMQYTPENSLFGLNFFYQQTTNIIPLCAGIAGYIGLFNGDFLHILNEIDIIRETCNVNAPDIINMLQNGRIEQRRAGFLFDVFKRVKRFCFGIELPLYVVARNYNLPLEDQHEIKSAIALICGNNSAPVNDSAYYRYVVDSRLGIGDTRLTLATFLADKDRYNMIFGAKLVIPTATVFTTRLIGQNFAKLVDAQYLDLQQLCSEIQEECGQQKAQVVATAYAPKALYQANAILLNTDLGESHRWHADIFFEPNLRLNDQIHLATSIRVGWTFPKTVVRYVLDCVNSADFADDLFNPALFPPDQKEQISTQRLEFLSARLQDFTFPPAYAVKLGTQLDAQISIGPWINFNDNWNMYIGYDYWHKRAESYYNSYACQTRLFQAFGHAFDRALIPVITENRLTFKGSYKKFKDSHNVICDFGADFPLVCHGIGSTYTGFLKVTWEF